MMDNIFGFKISPSSAINMDKVDRALFRELCRVEPDAARCMACGSCSGKVLLCLQRGREKEAFGMMSNCMLCGKCMMVCPRGINTRRIILAISSIYGKEEVK